MVTLAIVTQCANEVDYCKTEVYPFQYTHCTTRLTPAISGKVKNANHIDHDLRLSLHFQFNTTCTCQRLK